MMKAFGIAATIGALLGGALSNYIAPRAVAWYFEPPVEIGVNCRAAVEWGIQKFQWAQCAGTLIGAVMAMLIAQFFMKRSTAQKSTKI